MCVCKGFFDVVAVFFLYTWLSLCVVWNAHLPSRVTISDCGGWVDILHFIRRMSDGDVLMMMFLDVIGENSISSSITITFTCVPMHTHIDMNLYVCLHVSVYLYLWRCSFLPNKKIVHVLYCTLAKKGTTEILLQFLSLYPLHVEFFLVIFPVVKEKPCNVFFLFFFFCFCYSLLYLRSLWAINIWNLSSG